MNIRALNNTDIKVDTSALFSNSDKTNETAESDKGVSFTETLAKAVKSLEKSVQKLENIMQSLNKSSTSSLSNSNLAVQAMLSGLSNLSSLSSSGSSSLSSMSSTYGMSSTYSLDMLKLQLQDIMSETAENALGLLGSANENVNYGYGRSLSIIRSETIETRVLQKI